MNKLTAEKCREMFLHLFEDKRQDGITLKEDLYMQALEIALPILEQQERGEAAIAEQSIGVWNPLTKEIAVSQDSGIKLVDVAHWHCHCTMEVIVRDMQNHPLVKAKNERGEGWIEWGGGECPTSLCEVIDVRWRAGGTMTVIAGEHIWTHDGTFDDIIAYRIIPERATNQNGEQ